MTTTRRLGLVMLLLASVESTGCGATSEESASGSDAVSRTATTATVTTRRVKLDGQCTLDVDLPLVDATKSEVTARIAKALDLDAQTFCGDMDAETSVDVAGGYTVVTNEAGILALTIATSSDFGGAHPAHALRTYNFSLEDGRTLGVPDVLTSAGVAVIAAECTRWLSTEEPGGGGPPPYSATEAKDVCARATTTAAPKFLIEREGFRLILDLPHASFVIGAEGVLVPWAKLEGATADGGPARPVFGR